MGKALVLLDFQYDFLESDGRLPIARSQVDEIVGRAVQAVSEARAAGDLIVTVGNEFDRFDVVRNLVRRWAAIAGTAGAAWDARIPRAGTVFVAKTAPSAFSNPRFARLLDDHQIRHLVLGGVYARACVAATARDALRRGFEVTLLARAIGCASDASRDRALRRLAARGARVDETGASAAA